VTVLRAGSATDVGRVRTVNQDCLLVTDGLFAVADGMGGHVGGEVAARVAVEALEEHFQPGDSEDPLLHAIQEANRAVWDRARQDTSLRGMGTTITAVALVSVDGEERLVVANVGDSRAYLLQAGEFSQLTADHSLVEEMVRAGELSEAEAVGHPHRHILTRALGVEPEIDIDSWLIPPHTGDRLLLCSDGLVNEVADDQIAEVLRQESEPEAAANRLVELARAHGGADNITVVIVDVDEGEPAPGDPDGPTVLGARADTPTAAASDEDPQTVVVPAVSADDPVAEPTEAPTADGRPAAPTPPRGPSPAARRRRITFRVLLFVLALLIVVGGAIAAVVWYARSSYFVGLKNQQITIFQGRPGGVLWFKPTVARRTGYLSSEVLPSRLPDLRAGQLEPSLKEANRYVANLVAEATQVLGTTPTTVPQRSSAGATSPVPQTTAHSTTATTP